MNANIDTNIPVFLQLASDATIRMVAKGDWLYGNKDDAPAKFELETVVVIRHVDTGKYVTIRHAGYPGDLHGCKLEDLDSRQCFRVEPEGAGFRLREMTKDEDVSLGHNTQIVRWARGEDGKTQIWQQVVPPPTKP
jgi:hypothetical protein